ncbi:MAG: glycosyl hydrolase 108 family protein [Hyphomonas sp.]
MDGLGFRNPRKATSWRKADVKGRDDVGGGRTGNGGCYVTIELVDVVLGRLRVPTTRYFPMLVADLHVPTQLRTSLQQSAMIDLRDVGAGVKSVDGDRMAFAPKPICVQMPWTGKWSGEVSILALRSEQLLEEMLALNSKLSETVAKYKNQPDPGSEDRPADGDASGGGEDDNGYESIAAVAGMAVGKVASVAASKFLQKIGYTTAVEVAKLIQKRDGQYQTRLRRVFDGPVPDPGYYELMPASRKEPESVVIDFTGSDAPGLILDGRTVRSKDHAIVRVTLSDKHENIEDVPGVGDAWNALFRVLESGGQPKEALAALGRVATMSPYLIDQDKTRLLQEAQHLIAHLRAAMSPLESEGGFESVQAVPLLRAAYKSLRDVWLNGFPAWDEPAAPQGETSAGSAEAPGADDGAAAPAGDPSAPVPGGSLPGAEEAGESGSRRFDAALAFCFKWEGGYSNHPNDRGGETNFGITAAVYNKWRKAQGEPIQSVKLLTHQEAQQIYWSNYWLAAGCDVCRRPLDVLMFDAAVNHGAPGAVKLLQRSINAIAAAEGGGASLAVDGAPGAMTTAAIRRFDTPDKTRQLCTEYFNQRRQLYKRIVAARPDQEVFLKGWMNRVADLELSTRDGGANSGFETIGGDRLPAEFSPFAGYVD